MRRIFLAICLIFGGMTMCSCSEPTEGIKKPETVTPPPARIELGSPHLGGDSDSSKSSE